MSAISVAVRAATWPGYLPTMASRSAELTYPRNALDWRAVNNRPLIGDKK